MLTRTKRSLVWFDAYGAGACSSSLSRRLRTLLADEQNRACRVDRGLYVQGKRRTSASRIPVVVHYTEELLTAFTRQQVLSRADARSRLRAPKPVFEVSRISELSGPHNLDGRASVAGVEHFERCDTRWRYDLAEGPVPEGTHQAKPLPRDARGGLDGDAGRPVRFCSGSDLLVLSGPTETAPAGPPPSKPDRS